ncbi:MAG: hypothetical protein Q9169_007825, partial [Polycauliona sp. 2 TL-2023]
MPVTIKTAAHNAEISSKRPNLLATSAQSLYNQSRHNGAEHSELLQSSFSDQIFKERTIYASPNGFLHSAIKAYNAHHHLTIRPDDVWFAILSQFNCYLNKAAEEVRHRYVAHKGKKKLTAVYDNATRYTVDFGDFAQQTAGKIEENVVDPKLRRWIMPHFSTTTETDMVVASVYVMGAMQAYFVYCCATLCWIPSVTLLGERADWVKLLKNLDKLATF